METSERTPRILLGVTGCIAAYKACEIVRGLQEQGTDVNVVMTEGATKFVGRVTFDALTGHRTLTSTFDEEGHPIPHIEMADWCDLMLIAPCTANVLAKIASGIADDLLTSTALAAWEKLAVAPAMNVHMYEAPATVANLKTLSKRDVLVIEPDSGYLACGDTGKGRLASIQTIVDAALEGARDRIANAGTPDAPLPLSGKKVLITAGPTRERIDDVRFVTNGSTGKMGYAMAEAARDAGADVTLVSGPVSLEAPKGVDLISVTSATEMLDAAVDAFEDADIAILTAAVCDHAPAHPVEGKLKKGRDDEALSTIEMAENPDILATLCSMNEDDRYVVGFAAESDSLIEHAKQKLERKGADAIVANDVSEGKAFGKDDDEVWFITSNGEVHIPEDSKRHVAERIIELVCANIV